MKNFKINNSVFKRLVSGGLALVLAGSFTGCSNSKNNTSADTESNTLYEVVADNKIISIEDLKLKNAKTNQIVEDIEAVLIGNKLERKFDLIDIIYNSSVESILINDEFISVKDLKLVNINTNQEIDMIDYALVGDELIPMKDYIANNGYEIRESKSVEEKEDEEKYEDRDLTDEEFYKLVDEIYEEYSEIGLDVKKEEIIDYLMLVNIDEIAEDNKDLITDIIGERKTENVELNAFDVYSAVITENNSNWCAKGLGWDSLILVSDTVFDEEERKTVEKIEARVKEIVEASNNKEEFNKLLNKLLMEMLTATEEEFNMEYGTGYSTMQILINFVRINFIDYLDKENAELIKNFIVYADEYNAVDANGRSYYENARSTGYYMGIYNLLTDSQNCVKTRTK